MARGISLVFWAAVLIGTLYWAGNFISDMKPKEARAPRPTTETERVETPKAAELVAPPAPAGPETDVSLATLPTIEKRPTEVPPAEQTLGPAAMESIVIIEGDEGTGTGFVARIRGVDFVVTNQHVIGGNSTIRVTTLRGGSVPVAGVFGAVGRDIAILRIEGDGKVPALKLAEDTLKTVKLGDRVAVVGNRRGGGVATQVSGAVQGIGPDRIEVDAPFQPGNSGSPIIHLPSGEVIGVASYSEHRTLDELDGPASVGATTTGSNGTTQEQRWFGFRTEGVEKWETVDLARWRVQAKKITDFDSDTEAIWLAMNGKFDRASNNPRVGSVVGRFLERYQRMKSSQKVLIGQEVQEFFSSLRALANSGVKDLKTSDYHDFFRTSEYWQTSIPLQLKARAEVVERLDKASADSASFLERIRRGG